ncbi:MAG: hypothetical protein ACYC1K_00865 [Minisyncoccota bacterium]
MKNKLNYKMAIGLGVVLYLISRFGFSNTNQLGMLSQTAVAMLQVAGVGLFIVGLYRWNKKIKERAKTIK